MLYSVEFFPSERRAVVKVIDGKKLRQIDVRWLSKTLELPVAWLQTVWGEVDFQRTNSNAGADRLFGVAVKRGLGGS